MAGRFLEGLLKKQRCGKHQAQRVLLLLQAYYRDDVLAALSCVPGVYLPGQQLTLDPPRQPVLRQWLADYAATGLPPAYLPKDEVTEGDRPDG